MSEAKDFLKALSENPEAAKMIRSTKEPTNIREAAELYAGIAKKTGISVSKETILEFLEKKEKVQQNITAKAESDVKVALSDDALDYVAGGGSAECQSTVNIGEWCWVSDGCSVFINYYEAEGYDPSRNCENMSLTYSFDDAIDGWEDWDAKCQGLPDNDYKPCNEGYY